MKLFSTILLIFCTLITSGQTRNKYDQIVDSLNSIGQQEKLIPYFKNELKLDPKNESILMWLGYLYTADNQFISGERYYREALALNPKCAICYMNIGQVYLQKKEYKKALEYFDNAVNADTNDARLYANRARLKELTGDNFGALFDFNKAIELDPKNTEYFILRGEYNSKQGYFSLALADINSAIALAPDVYFPYFKKASIYYENKMAAEALVEINNAIRLDPGQQVLYTGRGAIYAALKDHDKSIADYTIAIQLNPNDYLPYYNRSLEKYALEDLDGSCADIYACYQVLIKYDSENLLRKELESSISNYCDSTIVGYYSQRGVAFYNQKQYEKAVNIYSLGVIKFPNNSMLLSFRGSSYFALKKYKDALIDYKASIKNKDSLIADINLYRKNNIEQINEPIEIYINGFIASTQKSIAESMFALGSYKEALLEINKAIAIIPERKESKKEYYYNLRGTIFLAQKKYQMALNDFNQCIQLNSSLSIPYLNRAISKINLSNKLNMKIHSTRSGIDNQTFNPNWLIPVKITLKNPDANIISALNDCNKAIELDPKSDFGYYVRGQIKKMLNNGDYCYDLVKANDLGYPVQAELLMECTK